MALVSYSDSEGSDNEAPTPAPKPTQPKPTFQKVIDRSQPRKIKVDLPTVQPAAGEKEELGPREPPAKRAKTGGAFSGFNSLLPAPKRAVQSGLKPGVSLKTSSEAAFSRVPVATTSVEQDDTDNNGDVGLGKEEAVAEQKEKPPEPQIIGKATRFRPLSVANKKKPTKKPKPTPDVGSAHNGSSQANALEKERSTQLEDVAAQPTRPSELPPSKPKKSLFSMPSDDDQETTHSNSEIYEPLISQPQHGTDAGAETIQTPVTETRPPPNPASLQAVASDLNLTASERRQLFGRNSKAGDVNIMHFNMDHEYAANEQARQAGEVVQHRAVKTIAPGKHSLQQLVNNARSQQDAMEDKWADGRRERGEAGSKYGWGR